MSRSLQQFLVAQGYLHVAPDRYFGGLTQAAVEAFQSATGIVSSGTPANDRIRPGGPRRERRSHLSPATANLRPPSISHIAYHHRTTSTATTTPSFIAPIVGGYGGGGQEAEAEAEAAEAEAEERRKRGRTPDTTPPAVSLIAPRAALLSGSSVTLTATASDNVAIADVQF